MPSHVAPCNGVLGSTVSSHPVACGAGMGPLANRKGYSPRIGRHFALSSATSVPVLAFRLHSYGRGRGGTVSKVIGFGMVLAQYSWNVAICKRIVNSCRCET